MAALQSLEKKLNEVLVDNAPVQLPETWRKWLADYAWIFALVGFILGVISIIVLLPALGFLSAVSSAVDGGRWVFFTWLAVIVLIGYVVLLGVATPKLKRLEKAGWNLIFYSALFFLAYDVLAWFQNPGFGAIFGLLWNVAWAVVGLYFIFQVRGHFLGTKKTESTKVDSAKKPAPSKKK